MKQYQRCLSVHLVFQTFLLSTSWLMLIMFLSSWCTWLKNASTSRCLVTSVFINVHSFLFATSCPKLSLTSQNTTWKFNQKLELRISPRTRLCKTFQQNRALNQMRHRWLQRLLSFSRANKKWSKYQVFVSFLSPKFKCWHKNCWPLITLKLTFHHRLELLFYDFNIPETFWSMIPREK